MILILLMTACFAQAELFHGPVSASLAGTGRAAMDSAEGAFLNPALVPLLKGYELDGYYRDGALDLGQQNTTMGLGIGDNTSDLLLPGAFHYLRLHQTGVAPETADSELYHLAVGRMITSTISLGATVYRLDSKFVTQPAITQWNYSLGALWAFNQDMGVGYTLNNLAQPGGLVPAGLRQDTQQGLGFFASVFEIARVRVDVTRNETNNPDKKLVYMGGFESLSGRFAILRLGYRHDAQFAQNYFTAGLGFNGPRLKIDYSFEKNVLGTSGALHGVDIHVAF